MPAHVELLALKAILARCGQSPEGETVQPEPIVMLMVAKGLLTLTGVGTTAVTTPAGLALLARLVAEELAAKAAPLPHRAEQAHPPEHSTFPAPAVLPFKRRGEILRPVRYG